MHSLVDQSVRPKGQTCGSPLADLVEHFIVVHYCLFVFLNISVLLYIRYSYKFKASAGAQAPGQWECTLRE